MAADNVVHVAIAAPSEAACAEIEALLAAEADLRVVDSGAPTALAELLDGANADVLLLDPGAEAADWLDRIAERVPLPPTVVLSGNGHPERQLLALGVRAVLPRRTAAARLVAAVRAVAAGLVVLDPEIAGIEAPAAEVSGDRVDALTPRETEVLQLLAEGLPNKEIAGTLGISEHTVKFHLSAIFGKLGATSRTEAVAIGIRRGLAMV